MPLMLRFAGVGIASTVLFVLLYLALRGMNVPAQAANLVCQFVTAVANTTANRRLTSEFAGLRTRDAIRSKGSSRSARPGGHVGSARSPACRLP